jgi:plastocyanin
MRVPAWKPVIAAMAIVATPLVAMAPPVAATSGPIVITADMPSAIPTGHNWGFNDFFPRTLRVTQGQTIGFAIEGFHTATLLPAGVSAKADLKVHGVATADEDTALNVNGTTHAQLNIPALMPTSFTCGYGPNPCAFDGTTIVSSGAPLGPPPPGPFMVTINAAPGTYAFLCRIHPGMSGHITVVGAGGEPTSADHVAATVDRQVKADVRAGYRAEQKATEGSQDRHEDGTSTWFVSPGAQSPDRHVAVLEFLPQNIKIHAGDKVVWRVMEANEPHTVTFPGELNTDQVPLCETAGGAPDGPATPNHIPPQGPTDFTCPGPGQLEVEFGGGNGVSAVTSPSTVSDSGLMGSRRLAKSYGLPTSGVLTKWTVSFAGAANGTYTYICQIHSGMEGTIVVH